MSWAFAVDDDQDDPGDWVHAGFDEVGTLNGDTVETAFIEEWYFVLDGQVHYYSNSLLPDAGPAASLEDHQRFL